MGWQVPGVGRGRHGGEKGRFRLGEVNGKGGNGNGETGKGAKGRVRRRGKRRGISQMDMMKCLGVPGYRVEL